jgi:hypothetical protein
MSGNGTGGTSVSSAILGIASGAGREYDVYQEGRLVRKILEKLKRFLKKEPPGEEFAMVGAPKKPRPPRKSAAAAEPLE